VAKILVADDNSNIQKMVGLALKDQGIDVVAVGNGEAAVRKISDIRPDLVLADVFMPVRNGYEVCQYVKTDSSLAHIPVILLVGAFDPLDEQEAQRVGADGVLKKPFVPPDPLISMVKSALARAGVSLTGAPATPPQTPRPAADLLMNPNVAPRPLGSVSPITVPTSISLPALGSDSSHEDIPMRPAPVKIDAGGSPLAFGNLLGSTATQEEEDLSFIPTVHPELATERDWRSTDKEEEEEEVEEEPRASWRRDAAEEAFESDKTPGAVSDWRESGPAAVPNAKPRSMEWTPTKEKTDFVEAQDVPETVPAAVAEKVPSDVRVAAPAAPFAGDAWAAAIAAGSEEKTAVATEEKPAEAVVEAAQTAVVQESPIEAPVPVPAAAELVGAEATKSSLTNSWFQTSSSPWEAEAQKASQLASTWDEPAAAVATATTEIAQEAAPEAIAVQEEAIIGSGMGESVAQESPSAYAAEVLPTDVSHLNGEHSVLVQESEATAAKVETVEEPAPPAHEIEAVHEQASAPAGTVEAAPEEVAQPAPQIEVVHEQVSLSSAAVEAIREEAVQVTEDAQHEAAAPATEATAAAPSAPEPNMDDLVAKVLAKVSPEVLQAVTRDILKSVVEGIVRDELNSKKS
jgi:CheY-like chemotaxis protein